MQTNPQHKGGGDKIIFNPFYIFGFLKPVYEIEVLPDRIVLKQRKKLHTYNWSKIDLAYIQAYQYKAWYTKNTLQRYLTLEMTDGKKFTVNVTLDAWKSKAIHNFLTALESHISIQQKKTNTAHQWWLTLLNTAS